MEVDSALKLMGRVERSYIGEVERIRDLSWNWAGVGWGSLTFGESWEMNGFWI